MVKKYQKSLVNQLTNSSFCIEINNKTAKNKLDKNAKHIRKNPEQQIIRENILEKKKTKQLYTIVAPSINFQDSE